MSRPSPDAGLAQTLDTLAGVRLPAEAWNDVDDALHGLIDALDRGDVSAADDARTALANLSFQSRVRTRLGGSAPQAPAVAPTKDTPVLPIAGAVCGGLLLLLGWTLGGLVLFAGTAVLALFVFSVALAGTKRSVDRRAANLPPPRSVHLISIPADTEALRLRAVQHTAPDQP